MFSLTSFVAGSPWKSPSLAAEVSYLQDSSLHAVSSGLVKSGMQLIRAGATDMLLRDCSDDAVRYFTSIRIPAALIAGNALSAVFALVESSRVDNMRKQTASQRRLLLVYHVLMMTSFLLATNVIVVSTAMSNAFLLGVKNPLATSPYALLKREYDYEFTLTSWSFMTGVFSFMTAVAVRAVYQFDMLSKWRKRHACLACCSVSAGVLHLMGFVNRHLPHWSSLLEMTRDVLYMFLQRSLKGGNISELLSVGFLVGAVTSAMLLFLQPTVYTDSSASSTQQTNSSGRPGSSITNDIIATQEASVDDDDGGILDMDG